MIISFGLLFFFFFKQKTAYEMRISDWSSDVCSSDLAGRADRIVLELRLDLGLGQHQAMVEIGALGLGQHDFGKPAERADGGARVLLRDVVEDRKSVV